MAQMLGLSRCHRRRGSPEAASKSWRHRRAMTWVRLRTKRHEPGSKRVHTPRWQSVAARSSTERVSALRRWNMETNWMEDSWRILACTIFFLSFYVFVAVFFLSVCASFVICFTILKVVCFLRLKISSFLFLKYVLKWYTFCLSYK